MAEKTRITTGNQCSIVFDSTLGTASEWQPHYPHLPSAFEIMVGHHMPRVELVSM
jgi:hypothetical protein